METEHPADAARPREPEALSKFERKALLHAARLALGGARHEMLARLGKHEPVGSVESDVPLLVERAGQPLESVLADLIDRKNVTGEVARLIIADLLTLELRALTRQRARQGGSSS